MYYIYSILGPDGIYIGSTTDFNTRVSSHKSLLKRNIHHCCSLQNSWNLYKEESFIFSILETYEDNSNRYIEEDNTIRNLLLQNKNLYNKDNSARNVNYWKNKRLFQLYDSDILLYGEDKYMEKGSWGKRNRLIWNQYVKEAILTTEYPGYKYIYFKCQADIDLYFSKVYGADWQNLPWAKFIVRRTEESQETTDKRRKERYVLSEDFIFNGMITNYYIRDSNNYEYLVKHFVKKQNIIDIDKIYDLLVSKGYKPNYNKIRAYINKYNKTARQENPNRNIIIEFIRYYHNQGLSLRKIESALSKDGISMSYVQIRTILKEIEDEKNI